MFKFKSIYLKILLPVVLVILIVSLNFVSLIRQEVEASFTTQMLARANQLANALQAVVSVVHNREDRIKLARALSTEKDIMFCYWLPEIRWKWSHRTGKNGEASLFLSYLIIQVGVSLLNLWRVAMIRNYDIDLIIN